MNIELAKFLVECSENAGNEAELRENYSGRGMMGEETAGIVVDSPVQLLGDVLSYIKASLYEDEGAGETIWDGTKIPDIGRFRTDNMGRQIIIY